MKTKKKIIIIITIIAAILCASILVPYKKPPFLQKMATKVKRFVRSIDISKYVSKPTTSKEESKTIIKKKIVPYDEAEKTVEIDLKKTFTSPLGMKFIFIPSGEFIMGSKDDNKLAWSDEKPQHILQIPYDYWIGRFGTT